MPPENVAAHDNTERESIFEFEFIYFYFTTVTN